MGNQNKEDTKNPVKGLRNLLKESKNKYGALEQINEERLLAIFKYRKGK